MCVSVSGCVCVCECECVCVLQVLLVESRHSGQRFAIKVLYKSLQAMTAGKGRTTTNRAPVSHSPAGAVLS